MTVSLPRSVARRGVSGPNKPEPPHLARLRPPTATAPANCRLIALLPGRFDRLGRLFRVHAPARHLGDDVVDRAADGWAERLVIEVLVIGGTPEIVGDLAHERAAQRLVGPLDRGDEEARSRQL